MTAWQATRGKPVRITKPEEGTNTLSCPRCGGMLAAELVAAMYQLVCEKRVMTGPYCHCHDIDGSMWASLLPEEKAPAAEPPNDGRTSERKQP